MAVLTMKYTTQSKYNELTPEEKAEIGTVYYVKANSDSDFNAYYSNNRCYGAVPVDGEVAGIQQVKNLTDLPQIGKPNTIYAYYNELDELTLYYWDNDKFHYHSFEETYDIIDGGNAISKSYITYNK